MPANFLKKFAHLFAILVLGLWGLVLVLSPATVIAHMSSAPLNPALAGMLGAALFGLAVISFNNEVNWVSSSRSLGIAVAILAAIASYLMFGNGAMLVTPLTSMSLVAAATVAFFLII